MAHYQPLAANDEIELEPLSESREDVVATENLKLRRVADDIPWNAYLIAIVELAERFSYYGTTVVFVNFIQQPLPPGSRTGAPLDSEGQAGALGLGQRASTGITTANTFWVYFTPLVGAYIADAFWGRYKTICVAVGIALVGHLLLVYSALPSTLENPGYAFAVFLCAIVIMGTGTGAFKSNISPLVAEQYARTAPFVRTLDSGERVLVDPDMTIQKIYLYFYLFINVGSLTGQISMTYAEKFFGFWLAFALPTLVFLACPFILYIGRHRYITSPPAGSSMLLTSFRAFAYAARGHWSVNPKTLYKNFSSADFWDRVKPSRIRGRKPHWMTFEDAWVDELARAFGACVVFAFLPLYWLTYNQMNNNLTSQASTMQTHGLPNDILSNIDPLALIVLIPFCDRVLYPALGPRRTTPLKRMALGFVLGAAAMAWAAAIQAAVYAASPCGTMAGECKDAAGAKIVAPLSVWWQIGAYLLVAMSEILAIITGLEYAYASAPPGMRSIVNAVFQSTGAFASVLAAAFVGLASDPLLVWNYAVMGAIAGCTGLVFWHVFRRKDADDERAVG